MKIQCECQVDLPQCESREAASPCIYANCQIPIRFPIFPLLAKFPLTDGNTRMTPTSTSNGGFDQGVQLLITADRQLQVPGRDPLDFEILGSVPSQLQHLQDSRKRWECRGEGCWVWGGGVLPQRSGTRGWLHCTRLPWLPRARGWWSESSGACGCGRPGTGGQLTTSLTPTAPPQCAYLHPTVLIWAVASRSNSSNRGLNYHYPIYY